MVAGEAKSGLVGGAEDDRGGALADITERSHSSSSYSLYCLIQFQTLFDLSHKSNSEERERERLKERFILLIIIKIKCVRLELRHGQFP